MYSSALESRSGDMGWCTFDVSPDDGSVARWTHTGGEMRACGLMLDRWKSEIKLFGNSPMKHFFVIHSESDFEAVGRFVSRNPQEFEIYSDINTLTLEDFTPIGPLDRFVFVGDSIIGAINITSNTEIVKVLIQKVG